MYKIIEVQEQKDKKTYLLEESGFCIINLINRKLANDGLPLNEEQFISDMFSEYDAYESIKRSANKEYSEIAEEYTKRIK